MTGTRLTSLPATGAERDAVYDELQRRMPSHALADRPAHLSPASSGYS
jgi:hypothetical protein